MQSTRIVANIPATYAEKLAEHKREKNDTVSVLLMRLFEAHYPDLKRTAPTEPAA